MSEAANIPGHTGIIPGNTFPNRTFMNYEYVAENLS
jgi:hypothetical protein